MCPAGFVKCPDSYCLPVSNICDGTRQCPNGDDEIDCCKFDISDLTIFANLLLLDFAYVFFKNSLFAYKVIDLFS